MEWWWLSLLVAITVVALLAYRRATREVAALTGNLEAALGALAPPPRYYYLRAEGPPQGPVDLTTLRAMVIDGRLGAEALTAPAGTDDWRPAARLFDDDTAAQPSRPLSNPTDRLSDFFRKTP